MGAAAGSADLFGDDASMMFEAMRTSAPPAKANVRWLPPGRTPPVVMTGNLVVKTEHIQDHGVFLRLSAETVRSLR